MKRALITGITGQDGSHLAELLLEKGYEVHGLMRRGSAFTTVRLDHLYSPPDGGPPRITLHYGDVTDGTSLRSVLSEVRPDEVYNLAAMSHVAVSFQCPEYTASVTGSGAVNVFNAVLSICPRARVYQASSSEMFGASPPLQGERTAFCPQSPYGAAKLSAHLQAGILRKSRGLWIACGILFNHGGTRRGETFVERKVTRAVGRIAAGTQECVSLGNLEARRDWGYAPEYVDAMWRMLQLDAPVDLVIGTGSQRSVRDLVNAAFLQVGTSIEWRGSGVNEIGVSAFSGKTVVRVNPRYYRPLEVDSLAADASLARKTIEWNPSTDFDSLINLMVRHDVALARKEIDTVKRRG